MTPDMIEAKSYYDEVKNISADMWVNENTVPTLIAYGTQDKVCPFGTVKHLVDALEENNVPYDFIEYPHSGHGLQNDHKLYASYMNKLIDYLELYLPVEPQRNYIQLANNLEWSYDASKIETPILLMSGGDDYAVNEDQLKEIYNDIMSDKYMAIRVNTEHNPMLYSGDGYVTAWFMYWLQGDEYAGTAFFGENAEIRSNAYWQDTDTFFQEDRENIQT